SGHTPFPLSQNPRPKGTGCLVGLCCGVAWECTHKSDGSGQARLMSAIPPKAAPKRTSQNRRLVPISDVRDPSRRSRYAFRAKQCAGLGSLLAKVLSIVPRHNRQARPLFASLSPVWKNYAGDVQMYGGPVFLPGIDAAANDLAVGRWPQIDQRPLQPAPHTRAIAAVDITELALEIIFLAGNDAMADDEHEGDQRR